MASRYGYSDPGRGFKPAHGWVWCTGLGRVGLRFGLFGFCACNSIYSGSGDAWRYQPDAEVDFGAGAESGSGSGSSSDRRSGPGNAFTSDSGTQSSPPFESYTTGQGTTASVKRGYVSTSQIPGSSTLSWPYSQFDSVATTSSSILFTASNGGHNCVLGRIFKAVDSVFVLRAATDCIMYVATKGEAVYLATNFDRSSKEKSRVELFETYNGTPGFPTTVFDHYGLSGVRAFDAVYTTVDGNIYRTPLQGGVSSYVFWQPRTDFVVSQGSLFFAAGSMIYGASIATGQTQTLASNRSNAQGIASDGPNFYWTETSDHPTLRDTRLIQIFRTPGNGGTIKKVGEVPTPPPPYPSGFDLHLAIDGTTAYASLFDQIYKQPLDL